MVASVKVILSSLILALNRLKFYSYNSLIIWVKRFNLTHSTIKVVGFSVR